MYKVYEAVLWGERRESGDSGRMTQTLEMRYEGRRINEVIDPVHAPSVLMEELLNKLGEKIISISLASTDPINRSFFVITEK